MDNVPLIPAPTYEQLVAALASSQAQVAALESQAAAATALAQCHYSQLAALVQHLPLGLLLVDSAGQIQLVNAHFRELFGLAADDTIAATYESRLPGTASIDAAFRDPAAFRARARALHAAGQTVLQEEFALADGRVVELDYLVLDHAQAGRLICYRDVTERHRRNVQLRMLSYIPQQNPNPILRLTTMGVVVYANPAAVLITQALAADAEGTLRQHLRGIVLAALHSAGQHQQDVAIAGQFYLCTVGLVPGEASATLYLTDITARRLAEQQLAEQRTFYETILEQVPIALAVVDVDFRYLFANPAVEPDPTIRAWMLGKTNEETCDRRQRSVALMELRRRHFGQAVSEQREVSWEEAFHDGQRQQFLLRQFRPVYAPDGALRFVIGSGIDITALKQAEEKATHQQEFYESILNYLPVDIAVFDAEHRFLFANPSSIANPDVRRQIIGMTNYEYFTYRQRPTALAAQREAYFQQAVHTRTDASWEETMPGPHGPRRILRTLRAVFQADDTLRLVVGSGIDITARYAAEEQQRRSEILLREQQDFIRLIVDTLPNVLYVIDEQGSVVFQNAAFDTLAARTPHRQPFPQLSPPVQEQVRQLVAWRQQVMTTQNPLAAEIPITMTSGEICHQQVHMRPLNHGTGPREVLVVSTDITALKYAQQAADANAQAKEAFLARMSHEIRTPLNGVLGMAVLLQKTPLTPAQQEYLATMQHAGQHLLALVNDVLDLAKITAHQLQLAHAPFDPAMLLQGAGQTVAALATQKGVKLVVEPLALAVPRVLGDAYRLHQILLNLLSNALKFTEQGSIHLGAVAVGQSAAALTLRFWVQDTGIGIAPEQQEHIFESFAQASADTSHRFGGTGLGLAISEQLVRQMGGTLRLCSVPGQGTTFSFTLALPWVGEVLLPLAPFPTETRYEGLRGIRILLAEDNLVNQWIARVLLEYWGVQVHTVANGTDALAQLSTHTFDAALLDIRMPGLSGVQVTTAIRQHPDPVHAAIPIIALTANAFETDRQHYLAVGMNGCVTKPFEEADLYQMLLRFTRSTPETGPA